jgi:hypothetical protein
MECARIEIIVRTNLLLWKRRRRKILATGRATIGSERKQKTKKRKRMEAAATCIRFPRFKWNGKTSLKSALVCKI